MALTLSEIASRIAELEGRDAIRVHAQLRNPAIRQLLTPIEGDRGRTTAIRFGPAELIRARIATVLIDIGHDAATIDDALSPLDRQIDPNVVGDRVEWPKSFDVKDEAGNVVAHASPRGLASIIRGVRQGEVWELRVRFVRNHRGDREVRARLALAHWAADDGRARQALDLMHAHTHLGDLTVPLAPLIAPLLSEIPVDLDA